MQYMLMFYFSPQEFENRKDKAKRETFWGAFVPYMKALQEAGVMVDGAGLEDPSTATSLRKKGDQHQVQDGPFADTKEQLAGYFIIEVPDLDTALQWAARYPGSGVEVRPCMPREVRQEMLSR